MPPAKKAAKKISGKHADPKHHESKDLRRAYEHLGRVEILQKTSGRTHEDVSTLAGLAQKELKAGHAKDAADLLRAAEHLSFADLGETSSTGQAVSSMLEEAVRSEFAHLIEKADDHWGHEDEKNRHPEVKTLYRSSLKAAQKALQQGSYRQALELARGAEALAHVKKHGPGELTAGKDHPKLATS